MVLFLRYILLVSLFTSLAAQSASDLGRLGGGSSNPFGGGTSSRSSNPFGSSRYGADLESRVIQFDLTKVGGLGRLETREKFDLIWGEFRRTHSIDVRGCFSPEDGANTPDNLFTQNAFQDYVIRHSPSLFVVEAEKCSKCGPDGTIPRVVNQQVVSEVCRNCRGLKSLKFRTEYRLVWPSNGSPKLPLNDEMRSLIGFGGKLPSTFAAKEYQVERSKFEAKQGSGFEVSDVSMSKSKGKLDLVLSFAGKPADEVRAVGCEVTFYSEEDGRGQVLASATSRAAPSGVLRLTFAQLAYPGVVAESYKFTADFYAEALTRLAAAKSVVVRLNDAPDAKGKLAATEKQPKVFAVKSMSDRGAMGLNPGSAPVAPDIPKPKRTFYGSGLVFTAEGHVFTNHHVIDEGTEISIVVFSNGQLVKKLPASIVSKDAKIDLAILKVDGWTPPEGAQPLPPRVVSSVNCKLGDPVFVLGYPLPSTLSSNVKYTKGDVSDTSGIGDDSTKIQHTAGIQPGNSGGPMALLDGRVVGVVVSSLSASYTMKKTGSLPQGVNFSIKTDYLLTMAKIAGIEVPDYPLSESPVEHVKNYTVQIMCE